jgi:hypothetical protein
MRPLCSSIRAGSIRLAAPALLAPLLLAACAVQPPAGPTVVASPGQGKTYPQFLSDDSRCRQDAANANRTAPQPGAAGTVLGGAATGTVLGGALGALIGVAAGSAGIGAAVGAGSGLLLGSAAGAGSASASEAAVLQTGYNRTYVQCMAAAGEGVVPPQPLLAAPFGFGPTAAYGYGG